VIGFGEEHRLLHGTATAAFIFSLWWLLLFGGQSPTVFRKTEEWNGASWSEQMI
jgi:hypothetical protein